MGVVYILTGVQASGKSTVAQALAERFDRSVHLHGDVFRRWIVGGRADLTPDAGPEARRQLALRHALTAEAATTYWRAGFTTVLQDVILGEHLSELVKTIKASPLHVVVLDPSPEVVLSRATARKKGYGLWTVDALRSALHTQTPQLGLWLDTSTLTVPQTVDALLAAPDKSLIR